MYLHILIIILIILLYKCYNNNLYNYKYKEFFLQRDIHPLNEFFDKVYVIALPKRKDHMIKLMNDNNIKANIFDALTPNTLDKDYLYKNNFISKDCELNNGRIYCHMSHISVLKDMIKNNYKNCFIFEDDINKEDFNNITNNKISKALNNLPKDYNIFYISKCWDIKHRNKRINKYIYKPYRPLCRHAYGVSQEGAKTIINNTLPMKSLHGDIMYSNMIKKGLLKAYSTYEQLYRQNRSVFGSNLGNNNYNNKGGPPTYINFNIKK